jgi:transcriptional regulator with XRE-family HTH domain
MLGNAPITPQTAVGLVLRNLRHAAGLSQEELGLESGVQRNFISLIETGQNQPTIGTLFRLATALGVKPSRIVAEVEKLVAQ